MKTTLHVMIRGIRQIHVAALEQERDFYLAMYAAVDKEVKRRKRKAKKK